MNSQSGKLVAVLESDVFQLSYGYKLVFDISG